MNCLKCLVSTEKVISRGSLANLPAPARRWHEMFLAENKALASVVKKTNPTTILEIGCGGGRLISAAFGSSQQINEIVGIERVKEISDCCAERFKNSPSVRIINDEIHETLPFGDSHFDLCVNSMNLVGWQDNEEKWLREMLRCSKQVFFTVYKKGMEEKRVEMYRTRGHTKFSYSQSGDVIVEGCGLAQPSITKAYSKKQISQICSAIETAKYRIFPVGELLYGALLTKVF